MTFQDSATTVAPPTPLQEQLWISRAQKGDLESFNALVLAYQRQVYNLAFRTTGNADEAADATQDAFLSAYRGIRSFRGGLFRSWLLRIAVNACYDRMRRGRRRPADSLDRLSEEAGDVSALPDHHPGPEGEVLRIETAALVQAGILSLPEDQRMVVVLSDVQGRSYDEISEMLGLPAGTVKSRLSRARARLREFLASRRELPT